MIRAYQDSDYEMICKWWASHNEPAPQVGMMNENCTFIYEYEDRPILSLSVYLTLSSISYVEGYISDPETPKDIRQACGKKLWHFAFEYAKENNAKHVIAYTDKASLVKRYEDLGMTKSINSMTALIRNLGV